MRSSSSFIFFQAVKSRCIKHAVKTKLCSINLNIQVLIQPHGQELTKFTIFQSTNLASQFRSGDLVLFYCIGYTRRINYVKLNQLVLNIYTLTNIYDGDLHFWALYIKEYELSTFTLLCLQCKSESLTYELLISRSMLNLNLLENLERTVTTFRLNLVMMDLWITASFVGSSNYYVNRMSIKFTGTESVSSIKSFRKFWAWISCKKSFCF